MKNKYKKLLPPALLSSSITIAPIFIAASSYSDPKPDYDNNINNYRLVFNSSPQFDINRISKSAIIQAVDNAYEIFNYLNSRDNTHFSYFINRMMYIHHVKGRTPSKDEAKKYFNLTIEHDYDNNTNIWNVLSATDRSRLDYIFENLIWPAMNSSSYYAYNQVKPKAFYQKRRDDYGYKEIQNNYNLSSFLDSYIYEDYRWSRFGSIETHPKPPKSHNGWKEPSIILQGIRTWFVNGNQWKNALPSLYIGSFTNGKQFEFAPGNHITFVLRALGSRNSIEENETVKNKYFSFGGMKSFTVGDKLVLPFIVDKDTKLPLAIPLYDIKRFWDTNQNLQNDFSNILRISINNKVWNNNIKYNTYSVIFAPRPIGVTFKALRLTYDDMIFIDKYILTSSEKTDGRANSDEAGVRANYVASIINNLNSHEQYFRIISNAGSSEFLKHGLLYNMLSKGYKIYVESPGYASNINSKNGQILYSFRYDSSTQYKPNSADSVHSSDFMPTITPLSEYNAFDLLAGAPSEQENSGNRGVAYFTPLTPIDTSIEVEDDYKLGKYSYTKRKHAKDNQISLLMAKSLFKDTKYLQYLFQNISGQFNYAIRVKPYTQLTSYSKFSFDSSLIGSDILKEVIHQHVKEYVKNFLNLETKLEGSNYENIYSTIAYWIFKTLWLDLELNRFLNNKRGYDNAILNLISKNQNPLELQKIINNMSKYLKIYDTWDYDNTLSDGDNKELPESARKNLEKLYKSYEEEFLNLRRNKTGKDIWTFIRSFDKDQIITLFNGSDSNLLYSGNYNESFNYNRFIYESFQYRGVQPTPRIMNAFLNHESVIRWYNNTWHYGKKFDFKNELNARVANTSAIWGKDFDYYIDNLNSSNSAINFPSTKINVNEFSDGFGLYSLTNIDHHWENWYVIDDFMTHNQIFYNTNHKQKWTALRAIESKKQIFINNKSYSILQNNMLEHIMQNSNVDIEVIKPIIKNEFIKYFRGWNSVSSDFDYIKYALSNESISITNIVVDKLEGLISFNVQLLPQESDYTNGYLNRVSTQPLTYITNAKNSVSGKFNLRYRPENNTSTKRIFQYYNLPGKNIEPVDIGLPLTEKSLKEYLINKYIISQNITNPVSDNGSYITLDNFALNGESPSSTKIYQLILDYSVFNDSSITNFETLISSNKINNLSDMQLKGFAKIRGVYTGSQFDWIENFDYELPVIYNKMQGERNYLQDTQYTIDLGSRASKASKEIILDKIYSQFGIANKESENVLKYFKYKFSSIEDGLFDDSSTLMSWEDLLSHDYTQILNYLNTTDSLNNNRNNFKIKVFVNKQGLANLDSYEINTGDRDTREITLNFIKDYTIDDRWNNTSAISEFNDNGELNNFVINLDKFNEEQELLDYIKRKLVSFDLPNAMDKAYNKIDTYVTKENFIDKVSEKPTLEKFLVIRLDYALLGNNITNFKELKERGLNSSLNFNNFIWVEGANVTNPELWHSAKKYLQVKFNNITQGTRNINKIASSAKINLDEDIANKITVKNIIEKLANHLGVSNYKNSQNTLHKFKFYFNNLDGKNNFNEKSFRFNELESQNWTDVLNILNDEGLSNDLKDQVRIKITYDGQNENDVFDNENEVVLYGKNNWESIVVLEADHRDNLKNIESIKIVNSKHIDITFGGVNGSVVLNKGNIGVIDLLKEGDEPENKIRIFFDKEGDVWEKTTIGGKSVWTFTINSEHFNENNFKLDTDYKILKIGYTDSKDRTPETKVNNLNTIYHVNSSENYKNLISIQDAFKASLNSFSNNDKYISLKTKINNYKIYGQNSIIERLNNTFIDVLNTWFDSLFALWGNNDNTIKELNNINKINNNDTIVSDLLSKATLNLSISNVQTKLQTLLDMYNWEVDEYIKLYNLENYSNKEYSEDAKYNKLAEKYNFMKYLSGDDANELEKLKDNFIKTNNKILKLDGFNKTGSLLNREELRVEDVNSIYSGEINFDYNVRFAKLKENYQKAHNHWKLIDKFLKQVQDNKLYINSNEFLAKTFIKPLVKSMSDDFMIIDDYSYEKVINNVKIADGIISKIITINPNYSNLSKLSELIVNNYFNSNIVDGKFYLENVLNKELENQKIIIDALLNIKSLSNNEKTKTIADEMQKLLNNINDKSNQDKLNNILNNINYVKTSLKNYLSISKFGITIGESNKHVELFNNFNKAIDNITKLILLNIDNLQEYNKAFQIKSDEKLNSIFAKDNILLNLHKYFEIYKSKTKVDIEGVLESLYLNLSKISNDGDYDNNIHNEIINASNSLKTKFIAIKNVQLRELDDDLYDKTRDKIDQIAKNEFDVESMIDKIEQEINLALKNNNNLEEVRKQEQNKTVLNKVYAIVGVIVGTIVLTIVGFILKNKRNQIKKWFKKNKKKIKK